MRVYVFGCKTARRCVFGARALGRFSRERGCYGGVASDGGPAGVGRCAGTGATGRRAFTRRCLLVDWTDLPATIKFLSRNVNLNRPRAARWFQTCAACIFLFIYVFFYMYIVIIGSDVFLIYIVRLNVGK